MFNSISTNHIFRPPRLTSTPDSVGSSKTERNTGRSFPDLATAQLSTTSGSRLPQHSQAGQGDANSSPSIGTLNISSTESSIEKNSTIGSISKGDTGNKITEKPPKHPARPGYGERGVPTSLYANYFKLSISEDLTVYRYNITVPDLNGKRRSQIISNALEHTQFDSLRTFIATDFSAILVSCKKLPQDCHKLSVPMATRLSADDLSNAKKHVVSFDLDRTYDFSQIEKAVVNLADHENLVIVQLIGIILGHHRKSSQDVAAVGKRKAFSLTDDAGGIRLNDVSKALRGYFCSVRIGGMGYIGRIDDIRPMVNINVTNSPFWNQASLVDVVKALQRDTEIDNTKISALLRGMRVEVSYMEDKRMIRTISGFAHHNDGHGYMPHPPKVPKAKFGPGPQEVQFFLENGTRKDETQGKAIEGKVKPHGPDCSCKGYYVNVAKYFEDSTATCYHIHRCRLTCNRISDTL